MTNECFFIEENELKEHREEKMTPSGRFRILIRYYKTGKNTWDYSRVGR